MRDVTFAEMLKDVIPFDTLLSAFSEAQVEAANLLIFILDVKCGGHQCPIRDLKIIIRYDFVNELVKRVWLEVNVSSEITVGVFFNELGRVVNAFKGEFRLGREDAAIIFEIPAGNPSVISDIINALGGALRVNFNLTVKGYEVMYGG